MAMKGRFDATYGKLKKAFDEAAAKGPLLKAMLGAPPTKKSVIDGLACDIPRELFGKEYFDAMLIVLSAHWFVGLLLDSLIAEYFMPGESVPRRGELVLEILPQTPFPGKTAFVENHKLLDGKKIETLRRINSVRNGFAHFYLPTDPRMHYKKFSITTEDGLERFWKDVEDVADACSAGMVARRSV